MRGGKKKKGGHQVYIDYRLQLGLRICLDRDKIPYITVQMCEESSFY